MIRGFGRYLELPPGFSRLNPSSLPELCLIPKRSAESRAVARLHVLQGPPVMKFRTASSLILVMPLVFSSLVVRGETGAESRIPVEQVVRMVEGYIAAEQLSEEKRAASRSGMV